MRALRPVFAAVSMHGHVEYDHATTSTCDARGLRIALLACESEIHTLLPRVYARICIITVREGGGEFFLRFCRADASTRKAANAHAHATDLQCKLLLCVYAHTGTPILTDGNAGHVGQEDGSRHPSPYKARFVFFPDTRCGARTGTRTSRLAYQMRL
jgi:hypothetical protein